MGATRHQSRADAKLARMHAVLAELATLDAELKKLEHTSQAATEAARHVSSEATPLRPAKKPAATSLDDELTALKRKMASAPPKKPLLRATHGGGWSGLRRGRIAGPRPNAVDVAV